MRGWRLVLAALLSAKPRRGIRAAGCRVVYLGFGWFAVRRPDRRHYTICRTPTAGRAGERRRRQR